MPPTASPPALAEVFGRIYHTRYWGDDETASGHGSRLAQTGVLRAALPPLLARLGARSLLDVPCGDHNWMAAVDLAGLDYVGADIVPELVAATAARHARPGRRFVVADAAAGPLPRCDVVLTRDLLVHLPLADVRRVAEVVAASGARWWLAGHWPGAGAGEIAAGGWRVLDVGAALGAGWPAPLEVLAEGLPAPWSAKSLGLWDLDAARGSWSAP